MITIGGLSQLFGSCSFMVESVANTGKQNIDDRETSFMVSEWIKKVGQPEGQGLYNGDTQCTSRSVLQNTI